MERARTSPSHDATGSRASCWASVVALLALAACGGEPADPRSESSDPQATRRDARSSAAADPRVRELLDGCSNPPRYDKDTAWVVPLLVEKLVNGEGIPMRRAQEELRAGGDEAGKEVLRFVERYFADGFRGSLLENAMGAAAGNPSRYARDAVLLAWQHPHESVRRAALLALLRGHVRQEDYEELRLRLDVPETLPIRHQLLEGMFAADRARAVEEVLDWLEEGSYPELWQSAGPLMAKARETGASERLAGLGQRLLDGTSGQLRCQLAAATAAAGSPESRAWIEEQVRGDDRQVQLWLADPLGFAGLAEPLAALSESEDPLVRRKALSVWLGLAKEHEQPTDDPRLDERLQRALDDQTLETRTLALEALILREDAAAVDRALAAMQQEDEVLVGAMRALRPRLLDDPELAARTFEVLLERNHRESHRPLAERLATFKGIGLVPSREAATFLRDLGLAHDGELLQGLRAHEWAMIQAGNTGLAGRGYLLEVLEDEQDPARRLDLIVAVAGERDELARSALAELAMRDERPFESLFLASRLVLLGPAARMASKLKRLSVTLDDGEARRAVRCLLWRWY